MAKLRIPKGDGFKVFGGEDAGGEDQPAAGESQENTTLANTATALLEGGGDEGESEEDGEYSAEVEEFYNEAVGPAEEASDDLPTGHYEQPAEGEAVAADEQTTDEQESIEPADDADQPVVGESVAILEEVPAGEVAAVAAATDLNQVTEAMRLRLQRAQAVREWQQNCEDAKEKFVAAALAHAELKAATKIAKAEEEDAMEEYAKLVRQNPDVAYSPTNAPMNTRPVAEGSSSDEPSLEYPGSGERSTTLVDNGEAAAANVVAVPGNPDAWKSTPITALTSLTPKLIEKLQDAGLHTMGKLAARQEEISLSDGREKWPKGIGEVKITAIEDAIIDWLNENRDKQVFAELASGAMGEVQSEGEGETEEDQPADGVTGEDDAANYVDGQAEGHESAAAQAAAILARAAEIDNGEPDSLDEKIVDAGYWEQGWNHHQNGEPLESCEWSASAAQDDFIRGYLSAAKADGYGKVNGEAAAAGQQESAANPANLTPTDLDLVDLDNL